MITQQIQEPLVQLSTSEAPPHQKSPREQCKLQVLYYLNM